MLMQPKPHLNQPGFGAKEARLAMFRGMLEQGGSDAKKQVLELLQRAQDLSPEEEQLRSALHTELSASVQSGSAEHLEFWNQEMMRRAKAYHGRHYGG